MVSANSLLDVSTIDLFCPDKFARPAKTVVLSDLKPRPRLIFLTYLGEFGGFCVKRQVYSYLNSVVHVSRERPQVTLRWSGAFLNSRFWVGLPKAKLRPRT